MGEKCLRCALNKECDAMEDQLMTSIYGYQCSYFSPILEQYHLKGFTVTVYQINPEDEDPDDGYDPFI